MKNPKLETYNVQKMNVDCSLDIVPDNKYFDYFIKIAHCYAAYVNDKFPNLDNKDKITHIYFLLLNAANNYKLTYGDCLLKGLAIDSFYTYLNEYDEELDTLDDMYNEDINYYKSMTVEENYNAANTHKIDL